MRNFILVGCALLAITGCVTESVYLGSDKPVVENKINNAEAARTRISLALKYLASGDSTQAKYNLERAAKLSPDSPEVHYTMAYYYQQVEENDAAKKSYLHAISLNPKDPNTLNNYGVFLCDLGEYDSAADYIIQAIEIPSYLRVSQSYENLALCAIENNKFDDAEKYFEASVRHGPSRGSSLINLSALYYAKSDLIRAKSYMQRYEMSGMISSRSLMLLYLIENRMGYLEKANSLSLLLQNTYGNSVEARQIKQNKISNSEFERLREQYRKNELNKLKKELKPDTLSIAKNPTIKILKRKAQPQEIATNEKSSVVANTNKTSDNRIVVTEQVKTTQPISKNDLTSNAYDVKTLPYHLVEQGESLFSISLKYDVKLAKLIEWNNLAEGAPVYPGTKIYLKSRHSYHKVVNGDTLYGISVKYNVLMKNLTQWNNLVKTSALIPGDKILLVDPKT